jgi:hypothetical protein
MRIKTEAASDKYVGVGNGLVMPAVVRVTAYDSDVAPDVEVDVIAENGRLVANEVRMRRGSNGLPITTESMRLIRVAELVKHAAGLVKVAGDEGENPSRALVLSRDDLDYVAEHGMTDRTLRIVADVYRLALLTGNPPTKMVEEWLEQPRSTAGRWIAAARAKRYLGDSEGPGRAGEARK